MTLRQDFEGKLKSIFKLDAFYDDQWETIERIMKGERVLLIEKTGHLFTTFEVERIVPIVIARTVGGDLV